LDEKIDLVLIGSSLSAEQKRKFWADTRDQCGLVLELYSDSPPELMDDSRAFIHHPVSSADFGNSASCFDQPLGHQHAVL
jgi:hypothetical protein